MYVLLINGYQCMRAVLCIYYIIRIFRPHFMNVQPVIMIYIINNDGKTNGKTP
jgi:hypothetical protein